jgi:hypothetical protein
MCPMESDTYLVGVTALWAVEIPVSNGSVPVFVLRGQI